jgi:hypothetical protein
MRKPDAALDGRVAPASNDHASRGVVCLALVVALAALLFRIASIASTW